MRPSAFYLLTRYGSYIVVLKKGDQILAEAATAGMERRVKGLIPSKEEK